MIGRPPAIFSLRCLLVAATMLGAPAMAQDSLDRADPARQERDSPKLPDKNPSPPTTAAPDAVETTEARSSVFAQSIRVEGASVTPADEFGRVIADFQGRRLDVAELRALASGIAGVARARGYPFASAWVPAQAVNGGVLVVRLDEGRIDEIRVEDRAVAAMLAPLADGRPVTRVRLERQLLLAGDLYGVSIGSTRFLREGTRGVLLVRATRDRLRGRFALDN